MKLAGRRGIVVAAAALVVGLPPVSAAGVTSALESDLRTAARAAASPEAPAPARAPRLGAWPTRAPGLGAWPTRDEGAGPATDLDVILPPLLAQRSIGGQRRPEPDARIASTARRRSPVVAGLLSALVPGAGQFYNGENSGFLFLGIETSAWLSWASLRATGNAKDREFKRFADAHWSWERYRDPLSGGCPAEGHSDGAEQDSILVSLYNTRRNDWYEDIGKLVIYACGWDSQENRNIYRDMRNDSNFFLRNARYATTVVFLNHLLSAVLAARSAARQNEAPAVGTRLDIQWSQLSGTPTASLVVSRRF